MQVVSTLFCFGAGYTAAALMRRLAPAGWRMVGTGRSEDRLRALRAAGVEAWAFDRGRPLEDPGRALDGVTHILSSVPPDGQGDGVLDHHGADLEARAGTLLWVGYLSTTAVYGDAGGGWVDEASPPRPSGERGRRRLAAEEAWLALWRRAGLAVHVFRLAGIYGPGRSAIDQVLEGTARRIDRPGQVFNRIHVDDIARILEASMARPRPGAIYNCADGEPAPAEAVVAYACRLLGRPVPPLIPMEAAGLSAVGRSFYEENKRVRADLVRSELGVRLAFPTWREGLAAIAAAGAGGAIGGGLR
jgi:nucleoside-diphosphate-sugar epimerase